MKIKGTCARCGREFLAQQVIESHGHCPWCGQPFNRDYTANLAQALQQAEVAGNRLQDALQQIAGMELAMELDDETILEPIRTELRAARRRRSKV
jgi:hypothetical protein